MHSILSLIDRSSPLFDSDVKRHENKLLNIISQSRFLVLGGAGSIGQAVVKEIFARSPKKLHVVDISENNLAELVRDIRSSFGYIEGDFKTYCLDIGSAAYDAFYQHDGQYDYVLNLSALKHVRSERDPFTLMRLIDVNIFNTRKTIRQAINSGAKKYFCVSTDKATNPVNMMGASKRIMELYLHQASNKIAISTARFANVLCSDGSLGHSFSQRLAKYQPIVAPSDVKRYFVTPKEAGELCLMSCLFGDNRDIFFPNLKQDMHLQTFEDIAIKFLAQRNLEPLLCNSEQEARDKAQQLPLANQWPCYFSHSNTTGEKNEEEFYTDSETIDSERFEHIGVIKNERLEQPQLLSDFDNTITKLKAQGRWQKDDIVTAFCTLLPNFSHSELNKYLDEKM